MDVRVIYFSDSSVVVYTLRFLYFVLPLVTSATPDVTRCCGYTCSQLNPNLKIYLAGRFHLASCLGASVGCVDSSELKTPSHV